MRLYKISLFIFIILLSITFISANECEENQGFCIPGNFIGYKEGYATLNYSCENTYDVCYPLEARLECEKRAFFCVTQSECSGNIYKHYSCEGDQVCCDVSPELAEECSLLGGSTCVSGEELCHGENKILSGGYCCIGECKPYSEGTYCASMGGTCVDRYSKPPIGHIYKEYDCGMGSHGSCYIQDPDAGIFKKIIYFLQRIFSRK